MPGATRNCLILAAEIATGYIWMGALKCLHFLRRQASVSAI